MGKGKGIDLARQESPEHAQLLDDFKDQLLIALINRQAVNGKLTIPIKEVDSTGNLLLVMSVKNDIFNFEFRHRRI